MQAYDYEAQQWIDGPEGTALLLSQIREEIDILESPQGADYVRMTTKRSDYPHGRTVSQVLTDAKLALSAVELEAAAEVIL